MSRTEMVIEGTLNADGTLELDEKPNLPPGRVTVVLRHKGKAVPLPTENWFEHLQRIRKKRESEGYPFMTEEEVDAHMDWLRAEDRIDEMLREIPKQ